MRNRQNTNTLIIMLLLLLCTQPCPAPMIFCNTCANFNGIPPVDILDYYLLLSEYGLTDPVHPRPGSLPKGCLDLIQDGVVNMNDLMAWDAIVTSYPSVCPWDGYDSILGDPIQVQANIGTHDEPNELIPEPNNALVLFGKSFGSSYLYGLDMETTALQSLQHLEMSHYSRLIADHEGNMYQFVLNQGLVGPSGVVMQSKQDVLFDPNTNRQVTLGYFNWNGTLLLDAAFDPLDPNIAYVVPVVVMANDDTCEYLAGAKVQLRNNGEWDLVAILGENPVNYAVQRQIDCSHNRSVVYDPDFNHLCEIEIDASGRYVFLLNCCEYNQQNYILIYDQETNAQSVIPLDIAAPANMVVSKTTDKLFLTSSARDPNVHDLDTEIYCYSLEIADQAVLNLVRQDTVTITCPPPPRDISMMDLFSEGSTAMVTALVEGDDGVLFVTGFTAPDFKEVVWGLNIQVSPFTRPWMAIVSLGETEPVEAFDISSWNSDNPLTLPLSMILRGKGIQ